MRKIIILSLLTGLFAGELEVEGNLTVTGDIVSPTIDALRDDGNYEYKVFLTSLLQESNVNDIRYYEYQNGVNAGNESSEWSVNFHNVLIPLLTDGWKIDNVIETANPSSSNTYQKNLYIFKRPIEE